MFNQCVSEVTSASKTRWQQLNRKSQIAQSRYYIQIYLNHGFFEAKYVSIEILMKYEYFVLRIFLRDNDASVIASIINQCLLFFCLN